MDVNVLNSTIIFAISYLVLVSANLQLSPENMSSQSCVNTRKNPTVLNNCTYHWPKVSCEMVTMATSNETLTQVDLKQYLRFVLQFRILGTLYKSTSNIHQHTPNYSNASETEASHECLSLENLTITKDKAYYFNKNDRASIDIVPFPILLQLAGLERINIEFAFKSRNPVAYVKMINSSATVEEVSMDYHTNFTFGGLFNASLKNVLEEKVKQFSGIQGTITQLQIEQSANIDVNIWENVVCNNSRNLKINGGRWTHLGNKQLPTMLFLKVLDLSANEINVIEDDTFELTPNLEELSLSNNKLTKLSSSIALLKNLQALDISRNPSLDLKTNNGVLKNLTNLLWLNLSHIPLMNLQSLRILYDQRNTSKLLGLLLRKCNLIITEDDVEFFDHMSFLVELDLSENQLSSIPVDLFRSLKNLKLLRLGSNRLSHKINLNLQSSINLQYMDLSSNKIVHLNQVQVEGTIDEINLSENAIISWENTNTFTSVEDLYHIRTQRLNLSFNSITDVSEDMRKMFSVLKSIDLGGNPLNCSSCNTPLLQRWLQENKTTIIFNLGVVQTLTCADLVHNFKNVADVNFSEKICLQDTDDTDFAMAVGVPLLVLAALILLSVIAVYGYRYEITYIRHLVNIRRQRHIKEGQSTERYKYDAFVSYSAADRDWVMKELQPHLEQGAERYRLCLHERDFALGSIIADNIVECMKDSRNTLVILTPHFVKSQWCRWELEVANHKLFEDDREFLILIELKKLDKKTLPRHLGYLVDTRTYLEWPKGHGSHPRAWARLKYALGESLYQRRMKERSKTKDNETNVKQDQVDIEIT